eukprot:CAMPEP_0180809378 /NCGR_PEP_ID=MMETSP1038_2-20121128/64293_1 /TAXON_ID=632150 /ORGANISM="Azadinium spinosum, Strain 3D9" /LENGTH=158 /DNA_ID=CAMNT_0022850545 /DNA_START=29 /DNA_END=502 /DNA_ORIENTATION=+
MTTKATPSTRLVEILGRRDGFCNNKVVTSHYTVFTFLPKNTYEQLSKPANFYFLFLCALQMIPEISNTGGIPTIALPLVCILALNATKDAIEDWRRHVSDRVENERTVLCVGRGRNGEAEAMKWCDVRVGDLLLVKGGEYVPADIVLLSSSHLEGHAY